MSKTGYTTKSQSELSQLLLEKKAELGKIVFTKSDPSQKINSSAVKSLRKDIARIQTTLNNLS
jgi:ribosomal protein L29